ncbi:RNA polymerase sigma factor [Nannocystaceae bacterium ST9]
MSIDSETWRAPTEDRWSTFVALYRDHYEFVWRCGARMGVSEGDLEDVVQETFVIALRRLDEFDVDAEGRASSWLFAILRNVIRNHARGERRRQARIETYGQQPVDLEQRAQSGQAGRILGRRLLGEFLDQLDDKRRAVFVLAELEGMTGREIADALAINVNTAHARLRAARQAFSEHFGELDHGVLARDHAIEVPEAARRRSWAVLVGLGPTQGLVLAGGGGVLGSLGLAKFAAGLGAIALVGVAGFTVQAVQAESTREGSPALARASEPVLPEPEPSLDMPEPDAREPDMRELATPEPSIVVTPLEPRSRPAITEPTPKSPDVTEALRELAVVREALLADEPERGLALLRATKWPAALAEQHTALEIGALCRVDEPEQARDRAERWQIEHPDVALQFTACWPED